MTTMAGRSDIDRLREALGGKLLEVREFRGEVTVRVALDALLECLRLCRGQLGFEMLIDMASLDHFGADPRFEVVYELTTADDSRQLRVKARVGEDESVPTASGLWGSAEWFEREVWDMMGIRFDGHPDLRRILMWEGYPYHPLRKDFPLAGRPSELPDVAFTEPVPLEGGPFVTTAGAPNRVVREPRAHPAE